MIVTNNIDIRDFEFWSGAKDVRSLFFDHEMKVIESAIEAEYDSISDVGLNDIFWFDIEENWEYWGGLIGYKGSFNDFWEERSKRS